MKFSVQRDQFVRILSRAQGIVDRKSTIAVLSHVLLETQGDDAIRLTCTDYDLVLIDRCPARVEREGKAVVGGKTLFDVIKVLPSVDVQFEKTDGERIHLEATNSEYSLPGFDPADFPRIQKLDKEPSFSIPTATLRRLLTKTGFCMSHEEARINLNGVFLELKSVEEGLLVTCVATDGHRLAKTEAVLNGQELPTDEEMKVIIHRKGIIELKKILDGETGECSVGFSSGEAVFRVGNASLYVREIDEEYPDYSSVIPREEATEVRVEGPEFLEGLKRVLPLADPSLLTVRLDIKKDGIILSSANAQTGSGQTQIFAEYEGEERSVTFNHRYLVESCSVVESPGLIFRLFEGRSLCIVVPSDPDEKALFVLMPVDET